MSRDSVVLGQCCFEVTKQWIDPGLTETLCTQEPVPTLVPEYKVLNYETLPLRSCVMAVYFLLF